LADGDAEAVAEVYDRYGARIYSVAFYITRDRGTAEEITQDLFAWLCTNAQRYDAHRGSLEGWLARLAHNRAIDWLRSRRGTSQQREVPLPDTPLVDPRMDLAAHIQHRVDLRAALTELAAEQREAIELSFWVGLSPKEIAVRQGCPVQTIYTRLRTGMDKLAVIVRRGEHEDTL
jgi:RNA polymerase sigma-70 factor (ECF subfamily)